MNPRGDLLAHAYEHISNVLSLARRNQEQGRSSVHQTDDISHAARTCGTAFRDYLSEPRRYKEHVQELQDRFSSWASLLGVFAAPSLCLDARLASEPALKELFTSMLSVLEENLKRGKIRHSQATHVTKENDVPMAGMTGAMDRLARLALLVCVSSKPDEMQRVLESRRKRAPDGFDRVIRTIIDYLCYQTNRNIGDSMKVQLTSSVAYRRDRLIHKAASHDLKIGTDRKADSMIDSLPTELQPDSHLIKSSEILTRGEWAKPQSSPTTSSRSQAVKSKSSRLSQFKEHETSSSHPPNISPGRVAKYPNAPTVPKGETKALCQFCRQPLPKEVSQEEWMKHVNEDLKPFICISEDCGTLPPSFAEQHEWEDHMQKRHGRSWARFIHRPLICPFTCGLIATFDTREQLQEHISQEHQGSDPEVEFALMTSCKKFCLPLEQGICAFCGLRISEGSGEALATTASPPIGSSHPSESLGLINHIADHLISISFLSIRWWDVDISDGSDVADNDSQSAAGSTKTMASSDVENKSDVEHADIALGDQIMVHDIVVPDVTDLGVSNMNELWEQILNKKLVESREDDDQDTGLTQHNLVQVYDGNNARLDVVFLHGLRGSMEDTWTKNTVLWPRDLLPRDLPEVRVYLFGYSGRVTHRDQANATKTEILAEADVLCAKLDAERTSTNTHNRPIIFIAYSLGGLVAAQILVNGEQSYGGSGVEAISKNLRGLIFLGTPFKDSKVAKLEEVVCRILASSSIDTQTHTLELLGVNSKPLNELINVFANVLHKRRVSKDLDEIDTYFFYETLKTRVAMGLIQIVEPESAQLLGRGDAVPIRADHYDICKFETDEDDGYVMIVGAIRSAMSLFQSPKAQSPKAQLPKAQLPKARSPQEPLYRVHEIVYVAKPGKAQPAGPYVVVSVSSDSMYTIRRQDNGQFYSQPVAEGDLLVRS